MLYEVRYAYGEFFEQDSKEIAKAESHPALKEQAKIVGWRSAVVVTPLGDHPATEARKADVSMMNVASNHSFNAAGQLSIGDLVMQAGRLVLVVAPAPERFNMD